MRCALWIGLVEQFPVALFFYTVQNWLSFTKSIPIQSLWTCCCNIISLATNGVYANFKCFCCVVLITCLQHQNKHEYNIDSLLNIQFATVLLQHYITYLQQHKQYIHNVRKVWLQHIYNNISNKNTTLSQCWISSLWLCCCNIVSLTFNNAHAI
jgi:hypothetical protein